jgi:hypothetical protein
MSIAISVVFSTREVIDPWPRSDKCTLLYLPVRLGMIPAMAMNETDILAAIDEQIRVLQCVKDLLEGKPTRTPQGVKRAGKSRLSPEARAKIVAAQKARWAKVRNAAK